MARVGRALEGARPGDLGVCLRWKDPGTTRALWRLAEQLRDLTTRAGAPLLVNERADVARAVGAEGVHLPANAVSADELRRWWPGAVVGRSTHDPDQVRRASAEECDFVTFGPVFETPSKSGLLAPRGLQGLKAVQRGSGPAPPAVFALGGITPAEASACTAAGAAGIACIKAVIDAPDPAAAVRRFLHEMETTRL